MSLVDVKHVSHIALRARDVERQATFYSRLVGLGETERDSEGRVYLRCNANHHSVVLMPSDQSGIDHFALDVGSQAAVESAATALAHAGIPYEAESTGELGQGPAIRLRDPDGFVIELLGSMAQVAPTYGT